MNHSGAGKPEQSLGSIDDLYFDTTNALVYKKTNYSTWEVIFEGNAMIDQDARVQALEDA